MKVGDRVTVLAPREFAGREAEVIRAGVHSDWHTVLVDGGPTLCANEADLSPELEPVLLRVGARVVLKDSKPGDVPGTVEGRGVDHLGSFYMVLGNGWITRVSARDLRLAEAPCRACGRPNDVGVKSCWCCGGVP